MRCWIRDKERVACTHPDLAQEVLRQANVEACTRCPLNIGDTCRLDGINACGRPEDLPIDDVMIRLSLKSQE